MKVISFHPLTTDMSGACDNAALTRNRNHDCVDNIYAVDQPVNCILCLGSLKICGITCMLYWVENVKYLVEGCLSKIWDQVSICYHGGGSSWNEELGLFSVYSLSLVVSFHKNMWHYNMCSLELLQSMTGYLTCLHQQGVLTCYGLDGLGFEFWSALWILFSLKSSRAVMEPTQPSVQWLPGFFPGRKAAGAWS
jgi:hypothetical protein